VTRKIVNRLALAALFAALVYAVYAFPVADRVLALMSWVRANPLEGALVYVVCTVVASVLFMPGSTWMLLAGYLFGFAAGAPLALLAVTLGAQAAFLAGRLLARDWVAEKVANHRRLAAIEAGLREEAFVIVALTRLSLVMPFNLLNYAYGITSVRAGVHFAATAVGMAVPTALYVWLGTLARNIGQILSGEATPDGMAYVVAALGVVAIALITWIMHRAASRALHRHLPSLEPDDD
jgi:uncharacterized membrane protein YdjX (TVP38/TMEM64 family)